MKFFGYLILLFACAAIGYIGYPYAFVPMGDALENYIETVTVRSTGSNMTMKIDMKDISEDEIPSEIKLLKPATLQSENGEFTVEMSVGSKAKVLAYEQGVVTVSDLAGRLTGKIPYASSDIVAEIAKKRLAKLNDETGVTTTPVPEKPVVVEQAEVMEKKPEGVEQAEVTETKELEKVVEAPDLGGPLMETLSREELIAFIQQDIKEKAVTAFSFDDVLKWEMGENETLLETEYQVGLATFVKETIFGKQALVAKALIRNGKIVKWVYANTGMEVTK